MDPTEQQEAALVDEIEALLARCRALSQRVSTYAKRLVGEQDALAVEVKSLQTSLTDLQTAACDVGDEKLLSKLLSQLNEAREIIAGMGPGGDLNRLCNPRNTFLVSMLLGNKTNLVTLRKDQAVAVKEEYHAFRNRAVWIMFVVPLMLFLGMRRADHVGHNFALTPPILTGVQIYLGWLMYFYISMALREGILLVNGSHIRAWWIQHHYWSALAALFMIALPVSSPTVYYFAENFMLWSSFQAVVMAVQNRYQRRRMYTRIALGKNSVMDVVSGESSGSSGQLLLLYPLLFLLQAWQCLIGVEVALKTWPAMLNAEGWLDMEPTQSDLRGMRGTFMLGVMFAWLAICNSWNTVVTITQKHRFKNDLKRIRSKAALAKSS